MKRRRTLFFSQYSHLSEISVKIEALGGHCNRIPDEPKEAIVIDCRGQDVMVGEDVIIGKVGRSGSGNLHSWDVNHLHLELKLFGALRTGDLDHRGTAQAGSTDLIILDSAASPVEDYYAGAKIFIYPIVKEKEIEQKATIISYDGKTELATVRVDN